ncbi:MAG: low affinity iron permease family protein [Opitutaceae bacterium]
MKTPKPASPFARFSKWTARTVGRPPTFILAVAVIVAWAVTGPIFHYSDTWQLVINTGTTIVTFLMVFLIQNTQNRDSEAIHVKLDELIRTIEGAHNALLDLEDLDENELVKIRSHYAKIALQARSDLEKGKADTGVGFEKPLPPPSSALPPRRKASGPERAL